MGDRDTSSYTDPGHISLTMSYQGKRGFTRAGFLIGTFSRYTLPFFLGSEPGFLYKAIIHPVVNIFPKIFCNW